MCENPTITQVPLYAGFSYPDLEVLHDQLPPELAEWRWHMAEMNWVEALRRNAVTDRRGRRE